MIYFVYKCGRSKVTLCVAHSTFNRNRNETESGNKDTNNIQFEQINSCTIEYGNKQHANTQNTHHDTCDHNHPTTQHKT